MFCDRISMKDDAEAEVCRDFDAVSSGSVATVLPPSSYTFLDTSFRYFLRTRHRLVGQWIRGTIVVVLTTFSDPSWGICINLIVSSFPFRLFVL